MRCLYCGKHLPLLKKLTGGGEFCSDAHKDKYHEEYNRLALSRLLQAQSRPEEIKVDPRRHAPEPQAQKPEHKPPVVETADDAVAPGPLGSFLQQVHGGPIDAAASREPLSLFDSAEPCDAPSLISRPAVASHDHEAGRLGFASELELPVTVNPSAGRSAACDNNVSAREIASPKLIIDIPLGTPRLGIVPVPMKVPVEFSSCVPPIHTVSCQLSRVPLSPATKPPKSSGLIPFSAPLESLPEPVRTVEIQAEPPAKLAQNGHSHGQVNEVQKLTFIRIPAISPGPPRLSEGFGYIPFDPRLHVLRYTVFPLRPKMALGAVGTRSRPSQAEWTPEFAAVDSGGLLSRLGGLLRKHKT